jgi:hypothetical protein
VVAAAAFPVVLVSLVALAVAVLDHLRLEIHLVVLGLAAKAIMAVLDKIALQMLRPKLVAAAAVLLLLARHFWR